jgi:hypothetical protein
MIDYFEGNLNREEKDMLRGFLEDHPDLKSEFDEFQNHYADTKEGEFKSRNSLKKQMGDMGEVDNETIDEYSIAYLENDLNETEQSSLLDAVEHNTEYKRTFRLYQLTKLQPDLSLVYKYKQQLKHFVLVRKTVLRTMGYAAAAAVIILGVLLINPAEEVQQPRKPIADINEPKTEPAQLVTEQVVPVIKQIDLKWNGANQSVDSKEDKVKNDVTGDRSLEPLQPLENKAMTVVHNTWHADLAITNMPAATQKAMTNIDGLEELVAMNQSTQQNASVNRSFDLMGIAKIGVQVFNKLNERNIELEPNFTSNGQLKSVTLITEQRKITTPAI